MTSLAENEGVCESTLDNLSSVLRTRRKYSGDPVLKSDVNQLLSISSRWIDDCLHTTLGLGHTDDLNILLTVADLIFAHSVSSHSRVFTVFYRSNVIVCFVKLCVFLHRVFKRLW